VLRPLHGVYQFGEFELDLDQQVLVRNGQRIALGQKAFAVLAFLVEHAGRVVGKGEIIGAVWPEAYDEVGILKRHIVLLRKALGDKGDLIVTVPGGYRFEGPVRLVKPDAALAGGVEILQTAQTRTSVIVQERTLASPAAVHGSRGSWLWILGVAVVAALAVVGVWVWKRRAPPRDHVSLVLAEFTNTTGDKAFDQMLGRALDIDLAQSPFLDVMSDREEADTLRLMGQNGDAVLTSAVAMEVCERANRQVVLDGGISGIGNQYLVTLVVWDCHNGKTVASAEARAAGKGKVLEALDSVAETVRSKLGESAQSIGRFDVPLQQAMTPSLEALKAYSVGKQMQAGANGDVEALPLFERAIELDPQFASAYGEIAVTYYNLSEPALAAESMKKAYDLRERVDEPSRLTFEAHYLDSVVGDIPGGVAVYKEWAETYPRDWVPWLDAANLYQQIGKYEDAIPYGRQALALNKSVICYTVLVRALKSAGRFAEAKALGQEAVRNGKDSGTLHMLLLEVAFNEGDGDGFARESQAGARFKDGYRSYFLGKAASMQGRFAQAEEYFHEEIVDDKREGFGELADSVAVDEATVERESGFKEMARKTLDGVGKVERATAEYAVERAKVGDTGFGERFLAEHRNDAPLGTGLQYEQLPQIRAALALARGKPLDAVAALEGPTPYGATPVSTLMMRGEACLQAKEFEKAAAAYRAAMADPADFDIERPLAILGLARAYAGAGNREGAQAEYKAFLVAWKDGDADVPVLEEARAELARLQ
jgi:DNA-binding winged helix-turn-helix (wHTH) protein/tetratricopeptide (TPR) repeat protein